MDWESKDAHLKQSLVFLRRRWLRCQSLTCLTEDARVDLITVAPGQAIEAEIARAEISTERVVALTQIVLTHSTGESRQTLTTIVTNQIDARAVVQARIDSAIVYIFSSNQTDDECHYHKRVHGDILISQNLPVNPFAHWHVYEATASTQVEPC